MGSSLPLRSFGQLSASVPVIGATCSGSVFVLLVIESSQLESSLLLRTSACLGPAASILRETHLELSMSLQSSARSGASVPILGMSRPELALPVLGRSSLGISVALRSRG